MSVRTVLLLLVALLSIAAPASAAPRRQAPLSHDPDAERAARAHFDRAEKAFNLGRFDEALTGYQAAYEALPLPAFLFDIAQCHRNLGNPEQAVFFYERYLSLAPDAANRRVVEDLIREQEQQRATRDNAQTREAPQNPTSPALGTPIDLRARPAGESPAVPLQPPPEVPRTTRWKTARWWLAGALGLAVAGSLTALALRPAAAGPTGSLGEYKVR